MYIAAQVPAPKPLSIGATAKLLHVTAHTLRYYDKIGILGNLPKDSAGRRVFREQDVERLRFIRRAQRMQFSLDDIRAMLSLSAESNTDKLKARELVDSKLQEIEENLKELKLLQKDLSSMLSECIGSASGDPCPILQGLNKSSE